MVQKKRDLKNQVSFCIIYLERLSDVLSDCPQLETNFEIASDFPGRDAISFYYDYLCKIVPQKLLAIKLKLPLCSWASPSPYVRLEGIKRTHPLLSMKLYRKYSSINL